MRSLFEYEISQNPVIGAFALHAAVVQCFKSTDRKRGVTLPQLMLVLPLVFHGDTRTTIDGMVMNGSLYKAVTDNRIIPLRVQARLEAMSPLTFRSLNIASAGDLIMRASESTSTFVPARVGLPVDLTDPESLSIIAASKRVGHWFASVRFEALCAVLRVRF